MDAGVPIKRPVSGIAMGLSKEGDDVVILSDIQGLEDFLGDMDFKVCGKEKGITALQMDNKAKGLSVDILSAALNQANEGRAFILSKMLEAISEPRAELKEYAPKIDSFKIDKDKIKDVIGKGGEVIRKIQEDNNVDIEILENGLVRIAAVLSKNGKAAKDTILNIIKDPEVGETYDGQVVNIKDFGAFVKILPGKDGLLHISKIAKGRINKVEDVLNVGDSVKVVITDIDRSGKISLDRLDKPDANSEDDYNYECVDSNDDEDGGYEGRVKRRR